MKIQRALIGKVVEVHWRDPKAMRIVSAFPSDHKDVPRGLVALAFQRTRGVIEFVHEGVVTIQKAIGEDPVTDSDREDSLEYDHIPEDLIVRVIEYHQGTVHGEPLQPPNA